VFICTLTPGASQLRLDRANKGFNSDIPLRSMPVKPALYFNSAFRAIRHQGYVVRPSRLHLPGNFARTPQTAHHKSNCQRHSKILAQFQPHNYCIGSVWLFGNLLVCNNHLHLLSFSSIKRKAPYFRG
jgi:hypothetical protein